MADYDQLFNDGDEELFRSLVSWRLDQGAADKRGISELEYVAMARRVWGKADTDEVYALKFLGDPLVDDEAESGDPSEGPYLILIARIDQNGDLAGAPAGYHPPDIPGVRLRHLVAGSPTGGEEPDPSKPNDYLLAFFDVLGFSRLLHDRGLATVYEIYIQLLESALTPHSEAYPWSRAFSAIGDELVPGLMWMPVHTAYFSDSILLWVSYHPGHVQHFFARCAGLFCKALDAGVAVRGAITVGEAVLDKENQIYLGEPLVEAARLEAAQDWVGASLGVSFKSERLRVPVPPDMVQKYQPPFKPGGESWFCDLVLDWPRVWRESANRKVSDVLQALSTQDLEDNIRQRYHAAIEFSEFSEEHQDWFLPPGAKLVRA